MAHFPTPASAPPRSDLHAPRPPARAVAAVVVATSPRAPRYACRSGAHLWPTPRDARRCCNGFVRVPIVDAVHGISERWQRDPDAGHDACFTPRPAVWLDPSDADTRTDLLVAPTPSSSSSSPSSSWPPSGAQRDGQRDGRRDGREGRVAR